MPDSPAVAGAGNSGPGLSGARVLVAGAGNIGSPLATLLARAGVGLLRVVDRDRVEAKNLATQDFHPDDPGRFKADALADRLRRQFPALTVEGRAADLEDLPLGDFEVDVVLGALDSRRARQVLASEIAWPLGVPLVDGGVGEGWLGRVQVFVPGPHSACLECGWGTTDYRLLAAEYPCVPDAAVNAPPTVSPAFAGSVVAGLMTAECVRLLSGERPTNSHEVAFDLKHRRFLPSRLRRSPGCRFDHAVIERCIALHGDTVGDLLAAVEVSFGTVPLHLECRRGLFGRNEFGPTRIATVESLRRRAAVPLAAFGFVAGDRVRVRAGGQSAFVVIA